MHKHIHPKTKAIVARDLLNSNSFEKNGEIHDILTFILVW
jgi:hypothetical protein